MSKVAVVGLCALFFVFAQVSGGSYAPQQIQQAYGQELPVNCPFHQEPISLKHPQDTVEGTIKQDGNYAFNRYPDNMLQNGNQLQQGYQNLNRPQNNNLGYSRPQQSYNPYQQPNQGFTPYQQQNQGYNPYQQEQHQGHSPYQQSYPGYNPYQQNNNQQRYPGQNPYQQNFPGQNPYQQNFQGQNPYQQNFPGQNPYQQNNQNPFQQNFPQQPNPYQQNFPQQPNPYQQNFPQQPNPYQQNFPQQPNPYQQNFPQQPNPYQQNFPQQPNPYQPNNPQELNQNQDVDVEVYPEEPVLEYPEDSNIQPEGEMSILPVQEYPEEVVEEEIIEERVQENDPEETRDLIVKSTEDIENIYIGAQEEIKESELSSAKKTRQVRNNLGNMAFESQGIVYGNHREEIMQTREQVEDVEGYNSCLIQVNSNVRNQAEENAKKASQCIAVADERRKLAVADAANEINNYHEGVRDQNEIDAQELNNCATKQSELCRDERNQLQNTVTFFATATNTELARATFAEETYAQEVDMCVAAAEAADNILREQADEEVEQCGASGNAIAY